MQMLYNGPTVQAAIAAALGAKKSEPLTKPSTFGKPIVGSGKTPAYGSNNKPVAKPSAFGKHDEENLLLTSDDLTQHRARAVQRAQSYLASANYDFGEPEDGYAEIFLIDLQKVIELPGPNCGRAVTSSNGTPQWEYDFGPYSSHPFYVLVFGHSHPDDSRNPSNADKRRLCRPSLRVPGARSSDRDLYPYAPVVIGCRSGARPYNENRQYRQWGS